MLRLFFSGNELFGDAAVAVSPELRVKRKRNIAYCGAALSGSGIEYITNRPRLFAYPYFFRFERIVKPGIAYSEKQRQRRRAGTPSEEKRKCRVRKRICYLLKPVTLPLDTDDKYRVGKVIPVCDVGRLFTVRGVKIAQKPAFSVNPYPETERRKLRELICLMPPVSERGGKKPDDTAF